MKNKIRTLLDAIFSLILFTLVFYVLLKRYTTPSLAFLSSFVLALLFLSIYLNASEKLLKNVEEKENMKNFFIFTPVCPQDYFAKALSKRYKVQKQNDKLIVENTEIYFSLSLSSLSVSSVVDAFKNRVRDNVVIMCFSYEKKALRLALSLPCNICVFDENKVFELLSHFKALPKNKIQIKKKYPFREVVKDFSKAKLNKRLLFSSLIIALFSFITPFNTYYSIISCVLLLLCILPYVLKIFFRQKENTPR